MPPFSGYPENDFNTSTNSLMSIGSNSDEEPRKSRRKELRFAEYDDVRQIPIVHEMPQDEIDGVWMSEDELQRIRTDCIQRVNRMDGKQDDLNDEECLRGLMEHSLESRQKRKSTRKELYQTVADIQSLGALQTFETHALMAELCQRHSMDSVSEALSVAMKDARNAM
jgi:hypothetical protein